MRKSFKKVLCAVMAASMVFSTPIATNVVAQAATGEDGYQSKRSDFYSVEGDFDVTFTLTNITSDMGGNCNTPLLDIRTAANKEEAALIAQYRGDNWINNDAGRAITTTIGQWQSDNATWMANGEWAGFVGICKDATATVNVKKSGATYYVTETFTGTESKQLRKH